MAISIDWANAIINVPKADTTLLQSTPYELRQLDTNWFRAQLRELEDDEEGRPWPRTHDHNEDVDTGDIVLADVLLILAPYTITFEDGQYGVVLEGTNNNILQKRNFNQVSVASKNSAGLIVVSSGSGLSQEEHDKLMGLPEEAEITADMDANSTQLAAIKERTDNLPNNPADVSDVPTAEENALELLDNQTAP